METRKMETKKMETKKIESNKTETKKTEAKKSSLCPNFKKCGGCQYLDMPYEKQLDKKQ